MRGHRRRALALELGAEERQCWNWVLRGAGEELDAGHRGWIADEEHLRGDLVLRSVGEGAGRRRAPGVEKLSVLRRSVRWNSRKNNINKPCWLNPFRQKPVLPLFALAAGGDCWPWTAVLATRHGCTHGRRPWRTSVRRKLARCRP